MTSEQWTFGLFELQPERTSNLQGSPSQPTGDTRRSKVYRERPRSEKGSCHLCSQKIVHGLDLAINLFITKLNQISPLFNDQSPKNVNINTI